MALGLSRTALLQQALVERIKALLVRSPAYVWRVLRVAFSPGVILRKLALVSLLQLLAYGLKLLLRAQRHNPLTGDRSARRMAAAATFEEWEKAHSDQPPQQLAPLPPELQLYCRMLDEVCSTALQQTAADCSSLPPAAPHCNRQPPAAPHCNPLHHTAT